MTKKQWKYVINQLKNGIIADGGNYFFNLGYGKNGKMWAIVIGWNDGFDNDKLNSWNVEGRYRLCVKLAYNDGDLQCDYDCDWIMPYDDCTGEVDNTEFMITGYNDFEKVRQLEQHFNDNYKEVI